MRPRRLIIGNGLPDLSAARRLLKAGLNFLLLEARDRLGGRIFAVGADRAAGLAIASAGDARPVRYKQELESAFLVAAHPCLGPPLAMILRS